VSAGYFFNSYSALIHNQSIQWGQAKTPLTLLDAIPPGLPSFPTCYSPKLCYDVMSLNLISIVFSSTCPNHLNLILLNQTSLLIPIPVILCILLYLIQCKHTPHFCHTLLYATPLLDKYHCRKSNYT